MKLYVGHTAKPNGCPDGVGALLSAYLLEREKGFDFDTVRFSLLDANPTKADPAKPWQSDEVGNILREAEVADEIIFMDVTPSTEILKRLLSLGKKVTVYDHHNTRISALLKDFPDFINEETIKAQSATSLIVENEQLNIVITEEFSGAELAYRQLHDVATTAKEVPNYIRLLGAMDLSTAPFADCVAKYNATLDRVESSPALEMAKSLTTSDFVKSNIEVYLLAAAVDKKFVEFNKEPMGVKRLQETLDFLESLTFEDALADFEKQIRYQEEAIANSKIFPIMELFLLSECPEGFEGVDSVLLISADNETGRTFESLAADYLTKIGQTGTIVAIANIEAAKARNFAGKGPLKVSLRWGSNDTFGLNLGSLGVALGAGGRGSAAVGMMKDDGLSLFKKFSAQQKDTSTSMPAALTFSASVVKKEEEAISVVTLDNGASHNPVQSSLLPM